MKVPILHLEEGIHRFEREIDGKGLNPLGANLEIKRLKVRARLNKYEKNISCSVALKADTVQVCDRCLTNFDAGIEGSFNILFHIGRHDLETDEEDVIMLPPEQVEIDLMPFIQEQLILLQPMKFLCREDCKGICAGCGVDLNEEKCRCKEEKIDPRWEKLQQLKVKRNP